MWRDAHGRLAAIVVLAGGLSSCMPTPRRSPPIRTEANVDDEGQHEHVRTEHDYFICGGDLRDVRSPEAMSEENALTPEERRDRLAAAIEVQARRCNGVAEAAGRHGEVRLTVDRDEFKNVSVRTDVGPWLTTEDRRCVELEANSAIDAMGIDNRPELERPLTVYVALGTAPPLFASTTKLATQWLAATRSKAAERRFAAQLPAEVTSEGNGCLLMPARKAFHDGLEVWLGKQTPLDEFWQPLVGEVFAQLTPGTGANGRAYWLNDQAMLRHRQLDGDRPREEICLFPFDDKLRGELRTHIDQRATCWAGDMDDILLHPRTEFPSGRRFKTVAAGPTRACALDDAGAVTCCGDRLPASPPAAPLSAVAVGASFDCGIVENGDLVCWGRDPPADGAAVPGPFQKVAIAGGEACAIRRDTRALECWRAGGSPIRVARDGVRDAAVSPEGVCALLEDGRISCRGWRDSDVWRGLHGPFRAFAAGAVSVCGVTAGKQRALQCWWNRDGWEDVRESDLPLFATTEEASEVAVSGSKGCVLTRSGRIACWPGLARPWWDGLYRTVVSGDGRFCALTVDGRVHCDREWPYKERS